jgi:glucose-6-phosphate isomerase
MATSSLWPRFQKYFLSYDEIGFSIDISRMRFADGFFAKMQPLIEKAFTSMRELEGGAIANPDEGRMVGHYWLRNPGLAPNAQLRADIEETNARIKQFAADVQAGKIAPEKGGKFKHVLLVGIGGSALGPQFIADSLDRSVSRGGGSDDFFVTFIEVEKDRDSQRFDVDEGVTSGDYLQGVLRGTRAALYDSGRESITLTIPDVTPFHVGALIALYERGSAFMHRWSTSTPITSRASKPARKGRPGFSNGRRA